MSVDVAVSKSLPVLDATKTFHASHRGKLFFIQPSAQHPGHWWAYIIEGDIWQGFSKPIVEWGLRLWASRQLPPSLTWVESTWDGREMTVPAGRE